MFFSIRWGWAAATLLLLLAAAPTRVTAEDTIGSFFDVERNTYFWLNTSQGEHIGDQTGYTAAGATGFCFDFQGAWLAVGQGILTNHGTGATNLGLVRRNYLGDYHLIGLGLWYDGYESERGNWFSQISGSFEWFRDDRWTLRANGYFPLGAREQQVLSVDGPGGGPGVGAAAFRGNYLITGEDILRRQLDEVAAIGADVEAAYSIDKWSNEVYAAYYHLQGVEARVDGVRGGVRGYLTPRLAANLTLSYDRYFGANVFGGFTWFFGGSGANAPADLHDKLTLPVQRREQIVVADRWSETVIPNVEILTNQGEDITVAHISQGASGTNAGTFENPLNSATLPATLATDIVFVHADGVYTNGYTLAEGQRLLGEGAGNLHLVMTDQLGAINLPEGNGGTNRPTIRALVLAASGSEISNLNLQPASVGLRAFAVTDRVNVNRTTISGGANGLEILGGSGRIDLTGVSIVDPSGFGLVVSGGSADVHFGSATVDAAAGLYGASSVNQGTSGTALFVANGHNGSFTQSAGSSIAASGDFGLLFDNADGDYDLSGPVTLTDTGTGIQIANGSAGDFHFANTAISNPSGTALDIRNSSANVDLAGSIVSTSTAPAVSVSGGSGAVNIAAGISNSGGRSVVVQNRTAGAVNMSGNITDTGTGIQVSNNTGGSTTFSGASKILSTGANTAVSLTSNLGHTVNFTGGGLNVNTSGGATAFQATGGGTVNVTGAGNHLSTANLGGTGTALFVENATIGAENLVFESISVNGASSGIILSNTGTAGGLKVTGDGSATRNGSGGSLRNTSGDALILVNTANVELNQMTIDGAGRHGVFGSGIRDGSGGGEPSFAFRNGLIQDQGASARQHALAFHTANTANITGTLLITDSLFQDFQDNGVAIANNAGSLALGIHNSTFDTNHVAPAGGAAGGEAIAVSATGSATLTMNVTENAFRAINGEAVIRVGTAGAAAACLNLVGNQDGSNGSPGTIGLDIAGTSTQTISQASTAALGADNFGAPVVVSGTGTLNFNGDCSGAP